MSTLWEESSDWVSGRQWRGWWVGSEVLMWGIVGWIGVVRRGEVRGGIGSGEDWEEECAWW